MPLATRIMLRYLFTVAAVNRARARYDEMVDSIRRYGYWHDPRCACDRCTTWRLDDGIQQVALAFIALGDETRATHERIYKLVEVFKGMTFDKEGKVNAMKPMACVRSFKGCRILRDTEEEIQRSCFPPR